MDSFEILHGNLRICSCFQAREKRLVTGILILPNDCLNLPNRVAALARAPIIAVNLRVGKRKFVAKNTHDERGG